MSSDREQTRRRYGISLLCYIGILLMVMLVAAFLAGSVQNWFTVLLWTLPIDLLAVVFIHLVNWLDDTAPPVQRDDTGVTPIDDWRKSS